MTQDLPKIVYAAYLASGGELLSIGLDNPDSLALKASREHGVSAGAVSVVAMHWKALKNLEGPGLHFAGSNPRRPSIPAGFETVGYSEIKRRALELYPKTSTPAEALALYRQMIAEGWERAVAMEFLHLRGFLSQAEDQPTTLEQGLDKIRALRAQGVDPSRIALWAIGWDLGLEDFFGGVGL